jgi:hypothetical protein
LAFHSGREADHSPSSSAEVKEWVELYFHSPNTPSWRGAQGEHRDNFLQLFNKIFHLSQTEIYLTYLLTYLLTYSMVQDIT